MYEYRAECVKVVDGDTVRMRVDLGFHLTFTDNFRLAGVDTPELRSRDEGERSRAQKAKAAVEALLASDRELMIRTEKSDKYGRWLAHLYVKVDTNASRVIATAMEATSGEPSHLYEGVSEGAFLLTWINVSRWLIERGYGEPYDGGRRG